MTSIAQSILAIDPTAQVSVVNEDFGQITWHDGNPNDITVEQIISKQQDLVVEAAEAVTALSESKTSCKNKLLALGLTKQELMDTFGI